MIDVTKPLRLVDGTPVEFVCISNLDGAIVARTPDGVSRRFNAQNGLHLRREVYALRNAPTADEADRRVRDAAHDLLAALKKLHDAIDSCVALTPELLAECRAIIARAEGGAA